MNTDYSELKPDYLKIATALRLDTESVTRIIPSPVSKSLNKTITYSYHEIHLDSMWENLIKSKSPYDGENKIRLEVFLRKYQLSSSLNDFLFLAGYHTFMKKNADSININEPLRLGRRIEILSALKFLYNNESIKLKIDIKHKSENLGTTILDPIFIDAIKKTLLDFYIKFDSSVKTDIRDIENFQDWNEYFDYVIENDQPEDIKVGRKPKHLITGQIIDSLQIYLQNYTNIIAEAGVPIARSQSTFIYEFLLLFDLIPDPVSWSHDNVRLILKKFRSENKY